MHPESYSSIWAYMCRGGLGEVKASRPCAPKPRPANLAPLSLARQRPAGLQPEQAHPGAASPSMFTAICEWACIWAFRGKITLASWALDANASSFCMGRWGEGRDGSHASTPLSMASHSPFQTPAVASPAQSLTLQRIIAHPQAAPYSYKRKLKLHHLPREAR